MKAGKADAYVAKRLENAPFGDRKSSEPGTRGLEGLKSSFWIKS